MDNCRVHLGTGIGRAIETVGATLRYLPKYSPDLNPIEMPYSKFKTFLRKVAARTIPSLNRAIRSFIPQIKSSRMCQLFQACRLCFNIPESALVRRPSALEDRCSAQPLGGRQDPPRRPGQRRKHGYLR